MFLQASPSYDAKVQLLQIFWQAISLSGARAPLLPIFLQAFPLFGARAQLPQIFWQAFSLSGARASLPPIFGQAFPYPVLGRSYSQFFLTGVCPVRC